jgi:uncharacterized membrane protein YkvA (DUF1232 family)
MLRVFTRRNRALYRYFRGKWEDLDASEEEVHAAEEEVEKNLTSKVLSVLGRLAESVVEDILVAYHVMRDPGTPLPVRAAMAAALIYFISPLDAVADVVPFGLADDAAILASALTFASRHITEEHRAKARERMDALLRRKARAEA